MDSSFWQVNPGHGMGPLELGAARDVLLQRIKEVGLTPEFEEGDPSWIYLFDENTELKFGDGAPPRLIQISVADERVLFGTLPVLGRRVHEIVALLSVQESETLWRLDASPVFSLPGQDMPVEQGSDRELFDRGTLWITTLGLGLQMDGGEISGVYLRQPQVSPHEGAGPFLPRQAELSQRRDLPSLLAEPPPVSRPPARRLGSLLTLGLLAALALILWQAVRYQQRWNQLPIVQGEVIAVDPPPPDPFPMKFTVAYADREGGKHQNVLSFGEINASPARKPGDRLDLRYLPEAPGQALSLWSAREAAIDRYLPWGIGVVAGYVILQAAVAILGQLSARSPMTEGEGSHG